MRRWIAVLAWSFVVAACMPFAPTPVPIIPEEPILDCRGVLAVTCQEVVADARLNAEPGEVPVRVQVVCSARPCTLASGEADVAVQYSSGRTSTYQMGWSNAEPQAAPPPPIPAPTCEGLPAQPCAEWAASAAMSVSDASQIASIVVRCRPGPCDDTRGEGETVVTLLDGTTTTSGWSYSGTDDD
jgi:hypothetical protein